MKTRSLFATLEVPDVIERHAGPFGKLLLRPGAFMSEAAQRLAEENRLGSFATSFRFAAMSSLTFHTIRGYRLLPAIVGNEKARCLVVKILVRS